MYRSNFFMLHLAWKTKSCQSFKQNNRLTSPATRCQDEYPPQILSSRKKRKFRLRLLVNDNISKYIKSLKIPSFRNSKTQIAPKKINATEPTLDQSTKTKRFSWDSYFEPFQQVRIWRFSWRLKQVVASEQDYHLCLQLALQHDIELHIWAIKSETPGMTRKKSLAHQMNKKFDHRRHPRGDHGEDLK